MDRTVKGLGEDGKAWRKLYEPLAARSDTLIDELFRPIVHVPRHPLMLAGFGLRALQPGTSTIAPVTTMEAIARPIITASAIDDRSAGRRRAGSG